MSVRLPLLPSDAPPEAARPRVSASDDAFDASVGVRAGTPAELMQVGDLARETGKTVRAIHLYEELGLLNPAARSKGRFRLYAPDAVTRIRWIGKLQDMGFSLTDIQTVVREWEQQGSAPRSMERMKSVYAKKLKETRDAIRRMKALEHELEASLHYLNACDVCDPQRLLSACSCCELHDKETAVPELVAGFRAK